MVTEKTARSVRRVESEEEGEEGIDMFSVVNLCWGFVISEVLEKTPRRKVSE